MYRIIHAGDGRRATIVAFDSRARAELQVLAWRDRQRRGGRLDFSHADCQALRVIPIQQEPAFPW